MINLFDFILNFHKKHRVSAHVIFWMLILIIGSFKQLIADNNEEFLFHELICIDFLNNFAKIPTAYFAVYYLFPRCFTEKKYVSSILLFVFTGYGIYLLASIIRILLLPYFGVTFAEEKPIMSLLNDPKAFYQFFFLKNLGGGAAMLLIKMVINYNETQRRVLTYEKQKAEIELKSLKSQLNPHFLFNTLNNIYALSIKNSDKTSQSIARLSEILDYILYGCNEQKVPLKNEILFLENYIELEKLRYNNLNIEFSKNIELDVNIVPLALLTLVENAFKHGVGEVLNCPEIRISLIANPTGIEFMVTNSYLPRLISFEINRGIGLNNLQKQLSLVYGLMSSLTVNKTENEFTSILKINFVTPIL